MASNGQHRLDGRIDWTSEQRTTKAIEREVAWNHVFHSIAVICWMLQIPQCPWCWKVAHAHEWLNAMSKRYFFSLPSPLPECCGQQLAGMSVGDWKRTFGEVAGPTLFSEFQLWTSAVDRLMNDERGTKSNLPSVASAIPISFPSAHVPLLQLGDRAVFPPYQRPPPMENNERNAARDFDTRVRDFRKVPDSRELFDGLPYVVLNAHNPSGFSNEFHQCAAERRERELPDVDHFPQQSVVEAGGSQPFNHPSTSGQWPQQPGETERPLPPAPASRPLLWQFLCSLLNRPRKFGTIIGWENQPEKLFRIKNSKELAALWGERTGNPRMTHETLTHGIRSYYGKKESIVLKSKRRRQLVYQFGPHVCVERY